MNFLFLYLVHIFQLIYIFSCKIVSTFCCYFLHLFKDALLMRGKNELVVSRTYNFGF